MVLNSKSLNLDFADLWPRYYFDLNRAKLEIADWLAVRNQEVVKDWRDEIEPRDWRHEMLDQIGKDS